MKSFVLLAAAASCLHASSTSAFVLPTQTSSIAAITSSSSTSSSSSSQPISSSSSSSKSSSKLFMADETEIAKAPTLNGKVVLPIKAMAAGLKGHLVPAVYAILNSNYKRGSGEGWEHVQHVSVTRDLANDISHFQSQKDASDAAHVRALSFSYPQKAVMEDFADGWKGKVAEATKGAGVGDGWGKVPAAAEAAEAAAAAADITTTTTTTTEGSSNNIITVGDDYEFDDDDDDMDDDDLDDYLQMMAESRAAVSPPPPPPLFTDNTGLTGIVSLSGESNKPDDSASNPVLPVISPFDAAKAAAATVSAVQSDDETPLELNAQNVDEVLDEVRPYLISDGGNVSVDSVDPETGDVYLLLEGACGSCASSTVTMQMGIERVLKEKFGTALGEVRQVEEADDDDRASSGKPTELTVEAVQAEVDRMATAIVAMGGVVRVLSVDPIGEVVIDFRGPNRVKKGLELAILDVEFVKHVKFVSE